MRSRADPAALVSGQHGAFGEASSKVPGGGSFCACGNSLCPDSTGQQRHPTWGGVRQTSTLKSTRVEDVTSCIRCNISAFTQKLMWTWSLWPRVSLGLAPYRS